MKLTQEQISTIKEIMDSHLNDFVNHHIPKVFQKVSTVRVKNTKRSYTIEELTWREINTYYGCHFPEKDEKILTFTYIDNDLGVEYMYDVNRQACIVIKLPDGNCLISLDVK